MQNDYAKPVIVNIEGGKLISGKKCQEIKELQGYASTQTGVYYYGNITTLQSAKARKKLSWIIKAKQGTKIVVEASQVKAGKTSSSIII